MRAETLIRIAVWLVFATAATFVGAYLAFWGLFAPSVEWGIGVAVASTALWLLFRTLRRWRF